MAARLEKTTGKMTYLYLFGMIASLFMLYPFIVLYLDLVICDET